MTVARITTINFKSKEDADESIKDYSAKAPSEFPEAQQLLQIRASDTTVMAVSLYADNNAMEHASAARGTIILEITIYLDAPSIYAASSISLGINLKKAFNIQTANGVANKTLTIIKAK